MTDYVRLFLHVFHLDKAFLVLNVYTATSDLRYSFLQESSFPSSLSWSKYCQFIFWQTDTESSFQNTFNKQSEARDSMWVSTWLAGIRAFEPLLLPDSQVGSGVQSCSNWGLGCGMWVSPKVTELVIIMPKALTHKNYLKSILQTSTFGKPSPTFPVQSSLSHISKGSDSTDHHVREVCVQIQLLRKA